MLILKRFVGQSIIVGSGKDRYEIRVAAIDEFGGAVLWVGDRPQRVTQGGQVQVPGDDLGPLRVIVEKVRSPWVRLGFGGNPDRRIVRAELRAPMGEVA